MFGADCEGSGISFGSKGPVDAHHVILCRCSNGQALPTKLPQHLGRLVLALAILLASEFRLPLADGSPSPGTKAAGCSTSDQASALRGCAVQNCLRADKSRVDKRAPRIDLISGSANVSWPDVRAVLQSQDEPRAWARTGVAPIMRLQTLQHVLSGQQRICQGHTAVTLFSSVLMCKVRKYPQLQEEYPLCTLCVPALRAHALPCVLCHKPQHS